jgi:hypothetical protein
VKPSEYFERYARDSHIEFFRGEDLPAGVPIRAGIYAWYGRVVVSEPVRAQASNASTLDALFREHVFGRYQRQPYDVTLSAALEPRFRGRVLHQLDLPSTSDWSGKTTARIADTVFTFLARSFAPAFSAPIYVGKAVKQPLSMRVAQHLSSLREYMGRSTEFLENQRRALISGELETDNEEIDAHSFAIEAAMRRFAPERLLLVTYAPPTIEADDVSFLENIVNRINYPICGRR